MAWTEKQYDAITSRGESLLVSAAAGSGKTSVLVERVTQLILEDRVPLERMLIVTFTNAAAAEMRERIYRSISEKLKDSSLEEDHRRFLRRQLNSMGRSHISTFHKFALDIIHDYYQIIDIKPRLAICDPAKQEIIASAAMEELFDSRFAAGDEAFLAFMDAYSGSRSDDNAKNMIRSLHTFLQSLPEPEKWVEELLEKGLGDPAPFEEYCCRRAVSQMDRALAYTEAAADEIADLPKLNQKLKAECQDLITIRALFEEAGLDEGGRALAALKRQSLRASKDESAVWEGRKPAVAAFRDRAKEALDGLKKLLEGFSRESFAAQQEALEPYVRELASLCFEFDRLYAKRKEKAGSVDFSDIEHFALRILKDEKVAEEYRQSFDWIFVDEYQDSNLVQESLISAISRPDNVFMVGDVKQSIYKFRLAEPEIFIGKYDLIKGGRLPSARVIDLSSNFRSKASVIDFVNYVFERLMTRENSGLAYDDDARLIEGAPYTGEGLVQPELYIVDMKDREDEAPEEGADEAAASGEPEAAEEGEDSGLDDELEELKAAELEALQAVRIIKKYRGTPIYDSKAKCMRPLEYRDMAILMYAVRGTGESWYRILSDAGIPVYLERSEGYFDALEIQVMMNLLRIIDSPEKDLPLLSVMSFPSFGFSADDLAAIRVHSLKESSEGRRLPYYKAVRLYSEGGPDEGLKTRCSELLEKLSRWKKEADFSPLSDFIWRLMVETGMLSYSSALPSGRQRLANLRALADKAGAYEAESSAGLYGFVNYIEAIKGKVDVGEMSLFSEDLDAVRIMTIHKSKGLEFPFVLLAGLGKRLNPGGNSSGTAVFHKDMGISMQLSDPERYIFAKPFSYRLISSKKEREEREEKLRVLYVALTRARDILVMSGTSRDAVKLLAEGRLRMPEDIFSPSNYLEMLVPCLGSVKPNVTPKAALSAEVSASEADTAELEKQLTEGFEFDEAQLPVSLEELKERLAFDMSSAHDIKEKSKYSVSQLAEIDRLEKGGREYAPVFAPPGFVSPVRRLSSTERGTAYHNVMEHLDFTKGPKDAAGIAEYIKELAARNVLSPEEAAAVDPAAIEGFFASDIGRRAAAADRLYKEAPFTLRREYKGREILVQGTIDCYFLENGQWVIIDYKSNYIDKNDLEGAFEELRLSYLPQLALYREALEKLRGLPVKEAVLYLFGLGRELRIE